MARRPPCLALLFALLFSLEACGFPDYQADLPEGPTEDSTIDETADAIVTDADAHDGDARDGETSGDSRPETPPSCPDGGTTATVQITTVDETLHGLGNVTVLFSNCTTKTFVADSTGALTVSLPLGTPLVGAFQATGRIPTLSAEFVLGANWSAAFAVAPASFETSIPKWSADHGAAYVVIGGTGLGACSTKDGVTFAVAGHPEVVVSYIGTTSPLSIDPALSATSTSGAAVISNIPGGGTYTISGTKSGCGVFMNDTPYDGFVPVVSGSLTLVPARLG